MDANFHKRFAQVREDRGMTLQEIADLFKITPQAVAVWEKTTKPKSDKLRRLAEHLRVREEWLAWGTGDQDISDDENVTPKTPDYEDSVTPFDKYLGRRVPLVEVEDIIVSKSGVRLSSDTYTARRIFTTYPCSENSVSFIMRDRSMEPRIEMGDIVVIDPELIPVPGDLVLVYLVDRDLRIFRKYSQGAKGAVVLTASNPNWETFEFTAVEWGDSARLIGVMSEQVKPRRT